MVWQVTTDDGGIRSEEIYGPEHARVHETREAAEVAAKDCQGEGYLLWLDGDQRFQDLVFTVEEV